MSKQSANITNFSGGLNNKTNPRDIADNQFQDIDTLSIETFGTLKIMGAKKLIANKSNNPITNGTLNHGNGLAYFKTDIDVGDASEQDTESLLIYNKATKTVKLFDYTDNAYEGSKDISMAKEGGSAAVSLVDYSIVDGNITISPHSPFNANNTCKWLGYVKRSKNLGLTTSGTNLDNIKHNYDGYYVDDMYISPPRGKSDSILWNYAFDQEINTGVYSIANKSEILLNPQLIADNGTASNLTYPSSNKMTASYQQIKNHLDNHAEYSSHFGTMFMYAWFDHGTTAQPGDGDILTYPNWGGGLLNDGIYTKYSLFVSNVYDLEESYPTYIGDIPQPTHAHAGGLARPLYVSFVGRLPNRPRQTGMKVYFCKTNRSYSYGNFDTRFGAKYLLTEIDFEKGMRWGGTDDWNSFSYPKYNDTTALDEDSTASTEFNYVFPINFHTSGNNFMYGTELNSFSDNYTEPWLPKEPNIIGKPGTGFKTNTILNRKAYIGNVSYSNESNTGTIHSKDTVFKSRTNEFGYFEYERRLEVEINDGDAITKLASLNGRLFEFKTKKLYIINLTRDIEYLEADLDYKGALKDYHVVNADNFIAWFNKYGVYMYDGEQIRELLIEQTGQEKLKDWSTTYYHDDAIIMYEPHNKQLIITNKSTQMVLVYDIKSGGWTKGSKRCFNKNSTNSITTADGLLVDYTQLISGNEDTGETLQFDIGASGGITIEGSSNPWPSGTILLIDSEKMTVTGSAGGGAGIHVVNVNRGTESTSAASHSAGAKIFRVQTNGIELQHWSDSPSKLTDTHKINEMALKTKDYTFGDPSVDKKIISVYLNYKNGEGVTLYGFSGDTEEVLATLEGTNETNNKTLHVKIKDVNNTFDTTDAFKKVKSFGLKLDGEDIEPDFEINDIQIIFRGKSLK